MSNTAEFVRGEIIGISCWLEEACKDEQEKP
jgi:hypothetical protein